MSSQPDTPIDVGGISDTQRTKLQELFDLFQDDIDTGLPNTIGGHLGTIQRMMDAQQKILEYRKERGRHEEIQCFSYSHNSQEHLALLGAQTNGSPPVPVEDVLSQLRLKDLAMDEKFDCHWEDVGDRLYDTLVIIFETTNVDWEMASRELLDPLLVSLRFFGLVVGMRTVVFPELNTGNVKGLGTPFYSRQDGSQKLRATFMTGSIDYEAIYKANVAVASYPAANRGVARRLLHTLIHARTVQPRTSDVRCTDFDFA